MVEKKRGYKVRNFKDGDEFQFLRLFNRLYENYGGYVLKDPQYWRWCCLERPDVEREGIFVVVDEEENVLGYAVVGKSGNIWEISYDSNCNKNEVISLLFDKAIEYVEDVGATSLTLNAPQEDHIISEVCEKFGFTTVSPPKMFISVLDLPEFISTLLEDRKEELKAKFNETVLVKLRDAPSWVSGELFLKISRDEVYGSVEPSDFTILVETDVVTLSSMLLGVLSPFRCLINLKLKIKPFWKIPTLLKIFSSLQLKTSWFFPLSDHG